MSLSDLVRKHDAREARRRTTPAKEVEVPIGPRRRRWGKSGMKGVYSTPNGRWRATLWFGGVEHRFGTHDTKDLAEAAVAAELQRRGIA